MKTLNQAISAFISHCRFEKNLSSKTIKAYRIDSGQFVEFVKKRAGASKIELVDKTLLRDYLQSISSFKPKTIKRKVATTKALFNFLEFEDHITANPFRKMRIKIKEPRVLPSVMNLKEIEKMIGWLTRISAKPKARGPIYIWKRHGMRLFLNYCLQPEFVFPN